MIHCRDIIKLWVIDRLRYLKTAHAARDDKRHSLTVCLPPPHQRYTAPSFLEEQSTAPTLYCGGHLGERVAQRDREEKKRGENVGLLLCVLR